MFINAGKVTSLWKYAFAGFQNTMLLAWDERGIAIPVMDQNERTAGTGIFLAISVKFFFPLNEIILFPLCHELENCYFLLVTE